MLEKLLESAQANAVFVESRPNEFLPCIIQLPKALVPALAIIESKTPFLLRLQC